MKIIKLNTYKAVFFKVKSKFHFKEYNFYKNSKSEKNYLDQE